MQTSQLPPQDVQAEMSILGGVLIENDAINTVFELMKCEDFYRESHRQVFQAMSALCDKREPIDLITLNAELRTRGKLEEAGGTAYLATLVDTVPMSANIAFYCKIVVQKSTERRLVNNAQSAIQIVQGGGAIEEAYHKLEIAIQPSSITQNDQPVKMEQCIREMMADLERKAENKGAIQGLPYGIPELDEATSGMHGGELIIIAGRPSMGKSALAGNIITNVSDLGKAALLFSLEVSRGEVTYKLAAGAEIDYGNFRTGIFTKEESSKLAKHNSKSYRWKLGIDDKPAVSLRDIQYKARRMKKADGLDLIVIDYLQLMAMPSQKDNDRVRGLGEISRGLKQLARELDIPIILLSQLNRGLEQRTDKRPLMSDLRDSGEIEQDADVILFPYRQAVYCADCKDHVNNSAHDFETHQMKAEILIEKQRAGERNLSIPACWIGKWQKFIGI